MDESDRSVMTEDFGGHPSMIDAAGVSLARRPRLYWFDWDLLPGEGVRIWPWTGRGASVFREVELTAEVDPKDYLQPGSTKASQELFPTFTTSRPRSHPGRRPAGLERLSVEERQDWEGCLHVSALPISEEVVDHRFKWAIPASQGFHPPMHEQAVPWAASARR